MRTSILRTWTLSAAAGLAALATLAVSDASANSVGAVEGARANERAGRALSSQDVENLRRYGSNDDGYTSGYVVGGPAFGVYVGPGYDPDVYDYDDDYDDGYYDGPYGPYDD